jgi:hypothetical protein
MPLFSSKNNTVSDKKMADLKAKAQKANKESMFSKKNVDKRLASDRQAKKSIWS